MRIAITGTHSTGKTTILEELRKQNILPEHEFLTGITRKLNKQGFNINEDGSEEMQMLAMDYHLDTINNIDKFITDRCALDGYCYTKYLWGNGKISDNFIHTAKDLYRDIFSKYDLVFYVKPEFDIVDDGVRSTNAEFRDSVANIFECEVGELNVIFPNKIIPISGSVEERVETIKYYINKLNESTVTQGMEIAHEAPLSIMNKVREITDYDYALVHLFEDEDIGEEYFDFFRESLNMGRRVILDNSMFELGESFDAQKFHDWCTKLNPTEYIIPDSMNNMKETIRKGKAWLENYNLPNMTPIGVVQGSNYDEMVECYKFWCTQNVKIAISFGYSFLDEYSGMDTKYFSKDYRCCIGRSKLISELLDQGVLDVNKKHHLLGCFLPQEFEMYKEFSFIDTIDTSNPVVHGLKQIEYFEGCLIEKVSQQLHTMIREEVDEERLNIIINNICQFRDNIF